jgi:hypothetical protein
MPEEKINISADESETAKAAEKIASADISVISESLSKVATRKSVLYGIAHSLFVAVWLAIVIAMSVMAAQSQNPNGDAMSSVVLVGSVIVFLGSIVDAAIDIRKRSSEDADAYGKRMDGLEHMIDDAVFIYERLTDADRVSSALADRISEMRAVLRSSDERLSRFRRIWHIPEKRANN